MIDVGKRKQKAKTIDGFKKDLDIRLRQVHNIDFVT